MGVTGLWSLLDPAGKPVTLESLQGKVLGVDVSVWLHQAMKGMRDKQGNTLHNAHLQVLFNRVCKLLFYKIKPVFVFDGGVPALKRQTLASRRQKREEATISKERTAKQLLSNVLKHHAVSNVLGKGESGSQISLPPVSRERDMFELNPIPEVDRPEEPDIDDSWEERMTQRDDIFAEFQNLDDIDVDSEDFKSLPPDVRHEILSDLKESRKRTSWARVNQLPEDSMDFSSYQVAKLMKQSKLSQRIENVRKELNSRNSGEITASLTDDRLASQVISSRIASDDTAHYILVKGLSKIPEEIEEIGIKHEVDHSNVKLQKQESNQSNKSNTEVCIQNINDTILSQEKCDSEKENKITNIDDESISVTDDESNSLPSNLKTSKICSPHLDNENNTSKEQVSTSSLFCVDEGINSSEDILVDYSTEGGFIKEDSDNSEIEESDQLSLKRKSDNKVIGSENDIKRICNSQKSNQSNQEVTDSLPCVISNENIEGSHSAINTSSTNECIVKVCSEVSIASSLVTVSEISNGEKGNASGVLEVVESDSDNDDFIEVTVDPSKIKQEDLFPSSIFERANSNKSDNQQQPKSDEEIINIPEDKQDHANEIEQPSATENNLSVKNLANEFEGIGEEELKDIQVVLEKDSASLMKEKGKQERLATSITDQIQKEAQDLLLLFGVPFIISPMEAEAQCAFLDFTNQTHGTITDDSDVWLFGGKSVYRNFFKQSKHVEYFSYSDVEKLLLLDRIKLINLAYLCGCDYTDGIQGIGPVTAMEILLEFPGEGIVGLKDLKKWWNEAQDNIKIPVETKLKGKLRNVEFTEGFPNIKVMDAFMNPEIDVSEEKFTWNMPDLDLLRDFAIDKLAWTKNKVDEMLLPVMKELNKRESQTQVTQFFTKEINTKSPVKSKRVKRILDRMKDITSQSSQAKSKKGKASKKLPAKNSKKNNKSAGGWLSNNPKPFQNNLNLSESSSDSDE